MRQRWEQILFCRNKLSASYPADVILQQKHAGTKIQGNVPITSVLGPPLNRWLLLGPSAKRRHASLRKLTIPR
jgi:hypothetical protein